MTEPDPFATPDNLIRKAEALDRNFMALSNAFVDLARKSDALLCEVVRYENALEIVARSGEGGTTPTDPCYLMDVARNALMRRDRRASPTERGQLMALLGVYQEVAEDRQRLLILADKLSIALARYHQPHTLISDRPCSDCDLLPGRRKGTNTEP